MVKPALILYRMEWTIQIFWFTFVPKSYLVPTGGLCLASVSLEESSVQHCPALGGT